MYECDWYSNLNTSKLKYILASIAKNLLILFQIKNEEYVKQFDFYLSICA